MKKFEKLKRDLDKAQADFSLLAKERNDAVSQLTKEMKEIERLEGERVELFSRIDSYERSKSDRKESTDVTKNMGDLNLKLKMEVGQVKFENEKLSKEREDVGNKLVSTKSTLRQTESDLKSCKSKLSEATESCTNLKNLLEATQIELKKAKDAEMSAKMEVTKAMKEAVSSSDGTSKVSRYHSYTTTYEVTDQLNPTFHLRKYLSLLFFDYPKYAVPIRLFFLVFLLLIKILKQFLMSWPLLAYLGIFPILKNL